MAMLDLIAQCWPGPVYAATVDHQLRVESAAEAAMVAAFCADADMRHAILRPEEPITGSVQAAARRARYALLSEEADRVGASWIVTAHHADDQLETVLMRLARGSGVDGLAGVRSRNGRVIRPMLGWTKAELLHHCKMRELPFADDPTNRNADFDRVRMRTALVEFTAIEPLNAVRSAQALADVADALYWVVEREAASVVARREDAIELHAAGYPDALLRRLVQRCLEHIQPGIAPRGAALDRLIDILRSGGQGMIGNILCRGGDVWCFTRAPARHKAKPTAHGTDNS